MLIADDDTIYYEILVDLLELIYHFPRFGSVFHDIPAEFLHALGLMLVES